MATNNIEFDHKNSSCDTARLRTYIENRNMKYLIRTYGCQMNQHDSEKLAGILEELKFTPAANVEDSDIILFNTCCVREHAEHKVFGNVGALKKLKSGKPSLLIGVCGCMMQQENAAKHLMSRFPFVNLTFGTQNSGLLPDMLCRVLFENKRVSDISQLNDITQDQHIAREEGPLAWVNIMYGCDNFCSYCIVPFVRGRERSRQPDDIVGEVQKLSETGYREVTLLGQNVNSYGRDLGTDFPRLLQRLDAETKIERIRFMTSHPKDLSDDLIDTIASCSKVCKQVHLPMQSGSSAILEKMNRRYTREEYFNLVHKLRQRMPDVGLSTDIIVGFPGETEDDFRDTLDMMQSIGFDSAYTFIFSKRSGTAAAKMENQIAPDAKSERIGKLIELQKSITLEKNRERVGQTYVVLVESLSKDKRYLSGRNDAGIMINFKGDSDLIGNFASIKVTDVSPHTMFGELV